MIHDVRLSQRAWRDLTRLADFLRPSSPGAAARAIASIWSAIESLDRFPERGAPTSIESVRQLYVPFGRAGYVIHYAIVEDAVMILRIFHSLEER